MFWAFAITFGASHVLRARQLVPESSLQSDFAADIIIAMFFLLLPLLLISSQCSFSPFQNHKDYNCTTLIHTCAQESILQNDRTTAGTSVRSLKSVK